MTTCCRRFKKNSPPHTVPPVANANWRSLPVANTCGSRTRDRRPTEPLKWSRLLSRANYAPAPLPREPAKCREKDGTGCFEPKISVCPVFLFLTMREVLRDLAGELPNLI